MIFSLFNWLVQTRWMGWYTSRSTPNYLPSSGTFVSAPTTSQTICYLAMKEDPPAFLVECHKNKSRAVIFLAHWISWRRANCYSVFTTYLDALGVKLTCSGLPAHALDKTRGSGRIRPANLLPYVHAKLMKATAFVSHPRQTSALLTFNQTFRCHD